MKPRFRIKELHLRDGATRYVPQWRFWIFWLDFRDFNGHRDCFCKLSVAWDFLQEIERREEIHAEAEVVGTSFIDYTGGKP